jgi:hypothetical protein
MGVAQVIEPLPNKHETLSLNSSTAKKMFEEQSNWCKCPVWGSIRTLLSQPSQSKR